MSRLLARYPKKHMHTTTVPTPCSKCDRAAVRRILSPARVLYQNNVAHTLQIGDFAKGVKVEVLNSIFGTIRQVSQVRHVCQVFPLLTNR